MTDVPAELIETTSRARRLARLRAYYEGHQHDGKPDFWTGQKGNGERVPVRERRPCVIYKLPRAAVNQATAFTFGEGRFPRIQVKPVDADGSAADGLTVTEDEARALEVLLAEVVEQARLRPGMRTMLRGGLSVGTGITILSLRAGRFQAEFPRAEHCWPTFRADDPTEVERLVWCYRFNKLVTNRKGELEERPHFFRRDITTDEHVVYDDAPIEEGKRVEWRRDEEKTRAHGLGFAPVKWCRNLAEEFAGDIDGCSLFEGLEGEFDALDLALSQRHRGINYWGAPQPWESGVGRDDGPATAARTALPERPRRDDGYSPASETDPARAVAVDEIWKYENDKAKVGLLETTGAAFEAATKHVNDVRGRALETMQVVLHDPATVTGKGELTGKALALLYAPLLSLVDELRDCWWPCGLRAVLEMALRMLAVLGAKARVFLPKASEVATLLQRFLVTIEGRVVWTPPPMVAIWGNYFSPANAEIEAAVRTARSAKDGGLIARRTAASYVASDFGVADVEAELAEAEEAEPNARGLASDPPGERPGTAGAEDEAPQAPDGGA